MVPAPKAEPTKPKGPTRNVSMGTNCSLPRGPGTGSALKATPAKAPTTQNDTKTRFTNDDQRFMNSTRFVRKKEFTVLVLYYPSMHCVFSILVHTADQTH